MEKRHKEELQHIHQKAVTFCAQQVKLTTLFHEGKGYSSLNVARSVVSMGFFFLTDDASVGSHPLVCTFLRGVFNRKPALPPYVVTWDADMVLEFLRKWSCAKSLSFPQLPLKVIILCC